jgi:hypothetical protein
MNEHFKKIEWKGIVKKSINTYWNTKFQLDCQSKSSLSLLSTTSLEMGKTHIVSSYWAGRIHLGLVELAL